MKFLKKNKILLILLGLTVLCLFFSIGHYSNLYLDVGREMYYPLAILEGKILYKDIFCIYGPFSYLLNALFFALFGAKLWVLYALGATSALLIVFFTYLISRKFLDVLPSFAISFFVLITGSLATRIFNFTLPYAYAMVYGLVFFLFSLFFLISFLSDKKEWKILVSVLFFGFAAASKYDFILYFIPLLIVLLKQKNPKLLFKAFITGFLAFFASFLVLFAEGLQIGDLIGAFSDIKSFTDTGALKTFYSTQGVYYTPRLLSNWAGTLLKDGLFIGLIYFGFKLRQKGENSSKRSVFIAFGALSAFLGFILGVFFTDEETLLPLTFVVLVLFLINFKKKSFLENILVLSALLVGARSLWGLSHANYGLYFLPMILVGLFILAPKKMINALSLFVVSIALSFALIDFGDLKYQNARVETNKGRLYTFYEHALMTNRILEFTNSLTEKNPVVAIFPEGLNINFLSDKKILAPLKYNSLIPLYTEGFGEDEIIEYYKNLKPDYIIFNRMSMQSYGKGAICRTYAERFCNFVNKNYTKIIDEDDFYIYKRGLK